MLDGRYQLPSLLPYFGSISHYVMTSENLWRNTYFCSVFAIETFISVEFLVWIF